MPPRHSNWTMLLLPLLASLMLLLIDPATAFLPACPSSSSSSKLSIVRRRASSSVTRLAAEGDGNKGGEKRELDRLFEEMERANTRSPMGEALKETVDRLPLPSLPAPGSQPSRPFRFPAYGFLLMSALLGISFTGSLTELATGHPLFGRLATIAIAVAAGPGFIGTFVVAVQRYNEECEEDNRRLEEEEGRAAREEEKGVLQGPVMMARRAPAPAAEKDDKEVDA